ncbi:class I SAM-dependent methyltransferase, partial [Candidatus Woesearchaeota archaeon]|nr:class I SAM-dependent methyltransferase [Candidatus Woesearchaeota archaeon]
MPKTMKYGVGYALLHNVTTFLARILFHAKRAEIKYILNLLEKEKDKKILDFGCNLGHLTNMIKKTAIKSKIYGADINDYALRCARRKYNHIKFYKINSKFLKKNKFDIIIISHVLEHVKKREKFMRNLSGLLSNNGKIIMAIPQERIRGDSTFVHLFYNFMRLRFENPHVVRLYYNDLKKLFDKIDLKIDD